MQVGTFEKKDGIIICTTEDRTRKFRFQIKDSKTLVFLEEGSSDPDSYGNEYVIRDGDEFVLEE